MALNQVVQKPVAARADAMVEPADLAAEDLALADLYRLNAEGAGKCGLVHESLGLIELAPWGRIWLHGMSPLSQ